MIQTEYFRLITEGKVRTELENFSTIMGRLGEQQETAKELISGYHALVEKGILKSFVHTALQKIISDTEFCPTWISNTEFPIIAKKDSVLSLRCFYPDSELEAIYAAPGTIVFSMLSPGSVAVNIYATADATSKPVLIREVRLHPNESVCIEPGQVFRITSEGGPALLSRLLIGIGEFTSAYDASSLDFINMISLHATSSRWYFMAKVAGALESDSALPILRQLTGHANYNVRWTALQELFNYDSDIAFDILKQFRQDPHDFIREQAIAEVDRISPLLDENKELHGHHR